jgi:hypothetical protein
MDNAQKVTVLGVLLVCGYLFYKEGGFNSSIVPKASSETNAKPIPPAKEPAPINEITCNCTTQDVGRLASKIESDYNHIQDELPSGMAKVMSRFGDPEKRDNCTWIIIFKISWPFGDTDGQHPDEFIKKRVACDGKEVYVQ